MKTETNFSEMKKLFFTGFLQVFLVVCSTYFVANKAIIGIAATGFLISFVWTYNVKKVNVGTNKDRYIYSFGAMCGSIVGFYFSQLLIGV